MRALIWDYFFKEQLDNSSQLGKGTVGAVTAFGATGISFVAQVEVWLRITSLVIGIAVGVLTCISIFRNLNKKTNNETDL